MPFPKILKKMSSKKSLRGSSEGSTEDLPPLPTSKYNDSEEYAYYSFPPQSARTSPSDSPRMRVAELVTDRSGSEYGYYSQDRRPSLPTHGERYAPPSTSRNASYSGSIDHTRARTTSQSGPARQPGYYAQYASPPATADPYNMSRTSSRTSPQTSPTPSRTPSSNSGVPMTRQPGAFDTFSPISPGNASSSPVSPVSSQSDPNIYRQRGPFISSPSHLQRLHVEPVDDYHGSSRQPSPALQPSRGPSPPRGPIQPQQTGVYGQLSNAPPSNQNGNGNVSRPPPQDELSRELADSWQIATTAPKQSNADKVLQTIETGISTSQAKQSQAELVVVGIKTGLDMVGGMDAIEQGLNTFMEGMPVLMNALDEIAKLHPFVGVAVMAFKAVWALEMKRRENDRKILALHMEMKDMMSVLTQLRNVKDSEEIAPDGTTIKGRMQELMKGTADDIKSCANACDTYTKKKLVVKILKGGVWEQKLVTFAGKFTKRRGEFEFALSIHTALGVDAANERLSAVDKKMDMMLQMFQQMIAPEQKEMLRMVEQKGGVQACQDNDKILKELCDLEAKSSSAINGATTTSKAGSKTGNAVEELKDDLMVDPDAAMEKNSTVFSRKFEVQKRQIVDELTKVVEREGDRVISAITAGPHDKLIDPDLHKIWKEMGWRGSIKSRHFVMALRDYYQENSDESETNANKKRTGDDWAVAYINVSRLQQISEAFDDDASGFVTTAEANTYTTSRPLDWSLSHWTAYWAIGFHQAMTIYAVKIRELVAKMFALRTLVLPANRASINSYLEEIYQGVTTLESGLQPCYVNEALQEKFALYVDAEEARLRGNLEAVDYDLDAANTLTLVTGDGRIERFIMPMLYLLLKRDFEIFRICQKKVIHPDELWDSADTIGWVLSAARERVELLDSTFQNQKVDAAQQFKTYAHGIFQYLHDSSGLWDAKVVLSTEFPDYPYDDALENQDVDLEKILNYPIGSEKLDFAAYNEVPPSSPKSSSIRPSSALKAVLGSWNGFTYTPASNIVPSSGMISMHFIAASSRRFTATSRSNTSDFTITGECAPQGSDLIKITFKQTFPTRFPAQYYAGVWSRATHSLTGTWGAEADAKTHGGVFIFKRVDPEHMCFFPALSELQSNKSRALWNFALSAVLYQVRKQTLSWTFYKERSYARKRFVDLYIRNTRFGKPLNRQEEKELGLIKKSFTTADSRFYHSIAEAKIRVTTGHDVRCDCCTGVIGGSRITCLTCRLEDTFDTVDFCDTSDCMSAQVVPSGMTRTHLPTHDILKLRRVVHIRQFGKTYREAKQALTKARQLFPSPDQDEDADLRHTGVTSPPRCASCGLHVAQPCWFCVQCEEPSFICISCEADPKRKLSFGYHNSYSHDLVRCQPLIEEVEITLEDRLADLEKRFIQHEANMELRLTNLEGKMENRLVNVDQRLVQVEKLLERIIISPSFALLPALTTFIHSAFAYTSFKLFSPVILTGVFTSSSKTYLLPTSLSFLRLDSVSIWRIGRVYYRSSAQTFHSIHRLDLLSFGVTIAVFGVIIYIVLSIVQGVSQGVENAKEGLKTKGVHITDKGVAVKTSKRFGREDYVDATQRGIVNIVNASSFQKGGAARTPDSESSNQLSPDPSNGDKKKRGLFKRALSGTSTNSKDRN
ncbi:hypothetical protein MIND_00962900 [Mycena indigotica]|uniref:Uncharacterized protein n=1 Tax=Mycena indigotica TaxID=2126181 RepID=A0A8H6SF97_9AGAR|nr:uncharacterized protein MIND_00962900 [Mycena indigotica]KAF7297297.1 hypothetical protein MIND_00962900 [Mycena indigotica]